MKFNNKLLYFYKNTPLRYKIYTIIRYAICPFDEIEQCVPKFGKIVDMGCGHGIFTNLLAMKSDKRHVVGMDINENKIKVAIPALSGRKNIEFRVGDLEESLRVKDIKCFTLIDVLCYIPLDKKRELLKKIYNILQIDGVLIIGDIQEIPRWKYWWTLFHMATIDKLIHRSFKKNHYFLKKEDYLSLLKDIGFGVNFLDISKGYPYSHCLYICNKILDKSERR